MITSPAHRQLCGRFNGNDKGVLVEVMEGGMVMVVELVLLWIKWVSNESSVIKIKHQCFSLRGYITRLILI